MPAKFFSIANQKGGVGKTTTAINLAAAVADQDIPTLIIDLDPQANATSGLGFSKEPGQSLYHAMLGQSEAESKVIPTEVKNLSLIPSELDIAALEMELPQTDNYLLSLKNTLDPLRESDRFEVVFFDCPPSLGMLSMNALAATDHLLIAMQCEYLAMEGLGQILDIIKDFKDSGVNPGLDLDGIIMTMFDVRTNLSRQVVAEVRRHFVQKVFSSIIPRSVRLGEAPSYGQTIFEYDRQSSGATAYEALAQEVIDRFDLKR